VGDHKQLRPKAEAYNLTVEARRGYDHNFSQFERLVTGQQPLPSVCLKVQHRMRPEISQLIRACTYPELQDHESVLNRPHLKGLKSCCSVVFINHTEPEEGERRVTGSSTAAAAAAAVVDSAVPQQSKVNLHEAAMAVETVKCLLQQGYALSQLVVLTPYLGQMRALRRALAQGDIGVMISELDQAALVKEGLDNDDELDLVSDSSGTDRGDRGAPVYTTAYSTAKRGASLSSSLRQLCVCLLWTTIKAKVRSIELLITYSLHV
jgi:AAA domain